MRTKLRAIRITKILFYICGLHHVVRPFSGALITLGHMGLLGRTLATLKGRHNVERLGWSAQRTPREALYRVVLDELGAAPFDYLEFGVFHGRSLRWWVEHASHAGNRFHGFDTFSGLPEDWGPYKAGDMSTADRMPRFDDARVTLWKGLFQDTLPGFLVQFTGDRRKVVHLDADLYTSTLYVLTMLHPRLRSGDILLFDEYAVPDHEFLALKNYAESYRVQYEVIGSRNNGLFFAVRIR